MKDKEEGRSKASKTNADSEAEEEVERETTVYEIIKKGDI